MLMTQGYKAIDDQIYEANSLKHGRDMRMGADEKILQHNLEFLGRSAFYSLPTYTFDD